MNEKSNWAKTKTWWPFNLHQALTFNPPHTSTINSSKEKPVPQKNPTYSLKIKHTQITKTIHWKRYQTSTVSNGQIEISKSNKTEIKKWTQDPKQVWKKTILWEHDTVRKVTQFKEQTLSQKVKTYSKQNSWKGFLELSRYFWGFEDRKTEIWEWDFISFNKGAKTIETNWAQEVKRAKVSPVNYNFEEIPWEEGSSWVDKELSKECGQREQEENCQCSHEKVQWSSAKLMRT